MWDIVLIVTVDFSKLLTQNSVVTFFDTSFEVATRAIDVGDGFQFIFSFKSFSFFLQQTKIRLHDFRSSPKDHCLGERNLETNSWWI